MATAEGLRTAIGERRAELHRAITEAVATWDTRPAGGEGEAAWSPREAAAHIILADWFFTNAVGRACGADKLPEPVVDAHTPGMAAAALSDIAAADDRVLQRVTNADLATVYTGRQMGTRTVQQMLERMATHLTEHIAQIRAVALSTT